MAVLGNQGLYKVFVQIRKSSSQYAELREELEVSATSADNAAAEAVNISVKKWKGKEGINTTDIACIKVITLKDPEVPQNIAKVIFNANGGNNSNTTMKVTIGYPYGPLPSVSRTGYNFDGWFTAAAGGKEITSNSVATDIPMLYAHWSPIINPKSANYTVTLYMNDGTRAVYKEKTIIPPATTVGSFPPSPTRNGFVFGGWFTDPTCRYAFSTSTPIKGNTDAYAKWTQTNSTYNIAFHRNGATIDPINGKTVQSGKTLGNSLPIPIWPGYDFEGWSTSPNGRIDFTKDTPVNADIGLYAKWRKR